VPHIHGARTIAASDHAAFAAAPVLDAPGLSDVVRHRAPGLVLPAHDVRPISPSHLCVFTQYINCNFTSYQWSCMPPRRFRGEGVPRTRSVSSSRPTVVRAGHDVLAGWARREVQHARRVTSECTDRSRWCVKTSAARPLATRCPGGSAPYGVRVDQKRRHRSAVHNTPA